MKKSVIDLMAGAALVALLSTSATAATVIIGDTYDVVNVNSGFNLGEGLNSGINPPVTRLTGTAAGGIRYLNATPTQKNATAYSINNNRMRITSGSQSGRATLSADGVTAFDFGPTMGVLSATPLNPVEYDVTISMDNNSTVQQRMSFAFGTVESSAGDWDFGLQLNRKTAGDNFYTISKRIDTGSSGVADINADMFAMGAGTVNTEVAFLIRVTDAGAESGAAYNSRVRVSIDGGATWAYDTQTDPALVNGFRFDGTSRYFSWDIAANDSPVTYDNFSVTWNSGPPPPSTFVWNGSGANDNWSTAANWVGGSAPSATASLVFGGANRQANVNDIADLLVPSLTFNNGGFSLSGLALGPSGSVSNLAGVNTIVADLNWVGTSGKSWQLASGSEVVLNNLNTVDVNGDFNILGGGALRLKGTMNLGQGASTATPAFIVSEGTHIVDGGTFASDGGYRIGSSAAGGGASVVLSNNASFLLGTSGANLRVGDSANPNTARLTINGSTLTMSGGILGIPYAGGATGAVIQTGGTVTGARVSFSDNAAGYGTYAITNGTLEAYQVRENTAGESFLYFNNATLRILPNATNTFMSGLNRAEIQEGGLTIDAQSDATISQNLVGTGSLTKNGSGILTIPGNNSYANSAASTLVNAGRLIVGTAAAGRNYRQVQVADAAGFGVLVGGQDGFATNNILSMGNGTTLTFDLSTFSSSTNAMLKVANLSASGFVAIELKKTGPGLMEGTVPLIDYDGSIGGGASFFVDGLLTLPPGVTGDVVNNAAETRIDLVITGVPGHRWTGAQSGLWDLNTVNWINMENDQPSTYVDGSPAYFLDGASTGTVSIDVPSFFPVPSFIVVSNETLPYVFANGGFTTPIFKKNGSGSLTFIGIDGNIFNGGIELNGGSLIASNGTFAVKLTDVTPSGTFVKKGPDELLLSSTNNTFDGSFIIEAGLLKLGHSDALGRNGQVTIANGTTLDLNDHQPGAKPIVVSGNGTADQGAIIDSTTGGAVETNLRDVTLAGDTTFGSSGRWDLRIRESTGPGPGLKGNGYNLSKVGTGHTSIASQRSLGVDGVYWNMNLGDVFIKEGQLTFAENLTPGNPAKGIYIWPGATLSTYNLSVTNPFVRNIFATNATILSGGGTVGDTNLYTGTLQINGSVWFKIEGGTRIILNAPIIGAGAVTVDGNIPAAMIQLNAANTYSGPTTVTNATLAGGGSILGDLNILSAATLAPGNGVGVFTVAGAVQMAGTNVMELNRNLSPNSDRLSAGGAISFPGRLKVVLAANPSPGDVYQLFNKGVSIPGGNIELPDISALPGSMTWDTSSLAVDGKLKVNGTAQPPSIGSVSQSGGVFTFSGTGGTEGATYYVVTTPDLSIPMANWTSVETNQFGPGGTFSFSTNITGSTPEAFFGIKLP